MLPTIENFVVLSVILVFLQTTVLGELMCYQCRGDGCDEPNSEQLAACDLSSLLPSTTSLPPTDFTTDSDMNFDDNLDNVQIAELPLLENIEPPESTQVDEDTLVIDTSDLPGADRFKSRRLAQASSDEERLRCITVTYNNSNEVTTARSCGLWETNNDQTCRQHVEGPMLSCYVCSTDGCNSADRSTGTLLTLAASIFVFNVYGNC